MVDISAIAGTISALKGAVDISKAAITLHDAQAIQGKVIELNIKILEAQSAAFAANDERTSLIEKIGHIEKEITALKAWDADKKRYVLSEVNTGVVAYTLKKEEQSGAAFHMLCANCYERGDKSYLQATQELRKRRRVHVCHHCKAEIELTYVHPPTPSQAEGTDFDLHTGR